MEANEIEQILINKYKIMDKLCNLKKNSYEKYSKKWLWWNHHKNLEFVISIIGSIASEDSYYKKVPRYLNETLKWLRYLKHNPYYHNIFSQKSYFQIFDYLCKCDALTFLEMYNDFNQNMGNFDEKSRNDWVLLHQDYLPKTSVSFYKLTNEKIVTDYNWRLSHQGNLSRYWKFIRSDLKSLLRGTWLNNREDPGKSSQYEAIITKKLLYDILDNLSPVNQIIAIFLATTGLRSSDAINCLISRWGDLQYFSISDTGRYYIPEVTTRKRKKNIHHIFISEELIQLLDYYIQEEIDNKIVTLLKMYDLYDSDIDRLTILLKKEFIKNLKEAYEKVKKKHVHLEDYQIIRGHLLRKFFITHTEKVKKELGANYLLYISGHKPLHPLYTTYNQHLRIVEINLEIFLNFIEPSVKIGFSEKKIQYLINRKLEIIEFFKINFQKYLEDKIEKDYFSLLNILEFFFEYKFRITSAEIAQLICELIQKNFIQKIGTFFSFTSENKINTIKKDEKFIS